MFFGEGPAGGSNEYLTVHLKGLFSSPERKEVLIFLQFVLIILKNVTLEKGSKKKESTRREAGHVRERRKRVCI
jgi:hypothetical protein